MSASFSISSSTGSYDVAVRQGLFAEIVDQLQRPTYIADAFFQSRFTPDHTPIFLEATETEKSLDRAPALIETMRARGANRGTLLVAVGGGVIQDIAAFAASVYMRGLSWSYIPSTVLAMVDSCIGGKSSINVGPYKNLVGTFHSPSHIYIDPSLAETLPRDQFASGLIEAAKICFCRGPESFAAHLATHPSTSMSTASLEALILNSLSAKKHFIEIDEFDKKERLLLNFGHTFGHAIEGASHFGIPHGIAVGLGILCSLAFQRARNIPLDQPSVAALESHLHQMIRTLPGLREQLTALDLTDVLNRFASDKKHSSAHFTLILIAPSGEVVLEQLPRSPALDQSIQHAISATIDFVTRSLKAA
jgi:3-dehydroquinate synthase